MCMYVHVCVCAYVHVCMCMYVHVCLVVCVCVCPPPLCVVGSEYTVISLLFVIE